MLKDVMGQNEFTTSIAPSWVFIGGVLDLSWLLCILTSERLLAHAFAWSKTIKNAPPEVSFWSNRIVQRKPTQMGNNQEGSKNKTKQILIQK